MMNCTACLKFMDAYMDGELEASIILQIEEHLDECNDCNAMFKLKSKFKESLRKSLQIKAPEHLKAKILHNATIKSRILKTTVFAPVAAAAILMFAIWNHQNSSLSSSETAALLNDVVNHHVKELPLENTNPNGQKAAGWFHGKVDFPVRSLEPGIKNVSFKGARVSNVREHPAAEMSYLVDGEKVTFMTFPSKQISLSSATVKKFHGRKYAIGQKHGYNVVMTTHNGIVYALSSQLSHKKLISLLSGAISRFI